MDNRFSVLALAGILSLAACGGGSTGTGTGGYTPPTGGTPAPTSSPAAPASAPLQEMVAGALAFVDPANHHTLYFVDGDAPPGTGCNGSCTAEWPVLTPASSAQAQGNLVIVTRIDGAQQWSFNGHALYEFAGDSGADQSNGVYGPWHIARPSV